MELKQAGVQVMSGIRMNRIHDGGVELEQEGQAIHLAVDQVIVCAGQQLDERLFHDLKGINKPVHRIGGALRVDELNAQRAIEEGTLLGMRL